MLQCQAVSLGGTVHVPGLPGAAASSLFPGSRVYLQERAGRPPSSPALVLLPDDAGHIGGVQAVKVDVVVVLDRRPLVPGHLPRRRGRTSPLPAQRPKTIRPASAAPEWRRQAASQQRTDLVT